MKRIFSGVLALSVLLGMVTFTKAADNELAGWSQGTNGGADIKSEIDYETHANGNPSLHIMSNQPYKSNVYYALTTQVPMEAGQKYVVGVSAKAKKALRAQFMLDWNGRTSLLPGGNTFDWRNMEFVVTATAAGHTLRFCVEDTGEIWLDDVYCYKYVNGQKTGDNLVKNGGFDGKFEQESAEKAPASSLGVANLDTIAKSIPASDTFSYDDLRKVYGGMKFIPAYPAQNGISIDGEATEWDDYPTVKLPTLESQSKSGATVEANFKFAYDNENFYFMAEVHDDILSVNDALSSYWNYDTIQMALSKSGELFGKEYTFGLDASGNSNVYGDFAKSDLVRFKAKRVNDEVTNYEAAIAWSTVYEKKPDFDILFCALYNDNDNGGRKITEFSPGISNSKDNTEYAHLRLINREDDLAWFEGINTVSAQVPEQYSFYYVNTSDAPKNVHISIPFAGLEKDVNVSARTGIRETVVLTATEAGTAKLTAAITSDNGKALNVSQQVNVAPNISRINDEYFEQMEKNAQELRGLISRCEEKGIPVRYETTDVAIYERFIPKLKTLIASKDAKKDRIAFVAENLEDIYDSAKLNLNAYLSGEKEAKAVPFYITDTERIEGGSVIGKTKWEDGTVEERPEFFIGYGHFSAPKNNIEVLNDLGANIMQMEFGVNKIIKEPSALASWEYNTNGTYDSTFKITDEEKKDGEHAMKITAAAPTKNNNYNYITQTVSVKPNTTYEWGLSAKGTNVTASDVWFSNDGFGTRRSLTGTYDWKDFKYTTTTGPTQTTMTIRIVCGSPTEALYIDNIYVREGANGANLITNGDLEHNGNVVGDFMVDTYALREVERALKRAEDSNVRVSFLLSPHYFPAYLYDLYPEMKLPNGFFILYDINHQKAREAIELYLKAVIPVITKYKSLGDICLTNEPVYTGKVEPTAAVWREYLYYKYDGDIAALNRAMKTSFNSFDEIPISQTADNSGEANKAVEWETEEDVIDENSDIKFRQSRFAVEWNEFVNQNFYEFHQWMADIVHEMAPNVPVHAKVMAHDSEVKLEDSDGTDYELFGQFSQIHGNDGWDIFDSAKSRKTVGPARVTYHNKSREYNQQKATKNMPVFNTEDHIMADGEKYYGAEIAEHIRADLWQGAIHGRVGSVIWALDEAESGMLSGLIHARPDCLRTVGYTNYDLNRLAYEVTAFQNTVPTVGILRSKMSKTYTSNESMNAAHSAVLFAGQKVDSIVDSQIADIHNYKLLILPEITHISAENLVEIERFVQNGGKIVGFGENLLALDDYDNPNDSVRVAKILKDASIYPSVDKELTVASWYQFCDNVSNEIKSCGLMNVEVVDAETSAPVHEVEWQCAEYNGKLLVNLCSYTWDVVKNVKIIVNGNVVTGGTELINGEAVGDSVKLLEYTPKLIEIGSAL